MIWYELTAAAITAAPPPPDCYWVLESDDSSGSKAVVITLAKSTMGYMSWEALLEEDKPDTTVTHRVRERP